MRLEEVWLSRTQLWGQSRPGKNVPLGQSSAELPSHSSSASETLFHRSLHVLYSNRHTTRSALPDWSDAPFSKWSAPRSQLSAATACPFAPLLLEPLSVVLLHLRVSDFQLWPRTHPPATSSTSSPSPS